jgi:hypothetical protein
MDRLEEAIPLGSANGVDGDAEWHLATLIFYEWAM